MNLYFVISGCSFLLILFGVFENLLKFYNINRWLACGVMFISCVFSVISNLKIVEVILSLNFVLYAVIFAIYFLKIKNIKDYFKIFFCSLIVVAVLMCYSAFDFADFEYSFVGIYVYVAIVLGFVFSFISPNVKTTFCGALLGSVVFDVVYWKFFNGFDGELFTLVPTSTLTFILVSICSYCVFCRLVWLAKGYRNKKKQETTN